MKRKLLKFFGLLFLLWGGVSFINRLYDKGDSPSIGELAILNIEALAQGENGGYLCINDGDIDCHGYKVEFKVEGLNLGY